MQTPERQRLIVRLIAVERGLHAVIFTAVAVLAILVRTHLAATQGWVARFLHNLAHSASETGQTIHNIEVREGNKFLHIKTSTLNVLIVTAIVYAVLESIEAVGLWHERRWAEYLTAVATAGLLPFEIYELAKGVTAFRVVAFVINVAVLVYLVYAKRLFGIRGGQRPAVAS